MRKGICISALALLTLILTSPAAGADISAHDHDRHPAGAMKEEVTPHADEAIQKYDLSDPQQNFGVQPIHDNQVFATFKADRFEHQWREDGIEILLWDIQGWIGNDYHKLYLESEGEFRLDDDNVEEATVELLYSRNIDKFWDLQAGLRHDFEPHPERSFAAVGVQGLAPQWFEVDATAYLSDDGDVSAKVEFEYELMLTQRLILIPRLESHVSFQDLPEYEEWEGITDLTAGARLTYQIRR
ncbi:MAG: copper resistance protein B, partial [Desulfuromonadales bacterium]